MEKVIIYRTGLVYTSACAEAEMDAAAVEKAVNRLSMTGLDHGWLVDDEPFRSGEPNPCPCNDHPETRKHWLLSC